MLDATPLSDRQSAPRSPADALVFSTVRIECEYVLGDKGTGTGFFFAFNKRSNVFIPAIVTNKHVVEGAARISFHLHLQGADGSPLIHSSQQFTIEAPSVQLALHPDPTVDLCVILIGQLIQQSELSGRKIAFMPFDTSSIPTEKEMAGLTPLEDIVMIGYPNGIWDSKNNMPILRRGITATHPGVSYEGRKEFMIDAACFPGSSGSPVVLYNTGAYWTQNGFVLGGVRVKLLGILRAGPQHSISGDLQIVDIPTRQSVQAISRIPNNLGVVIQAGRLREFEALFDKLLPPPS